MHPPIKKNARKKSKIGLKKEKKRKTEKKANRPLYNQYNDNKHAQYLNKRTGDGNLLTTKEMKWITC